MAGHRRKSHEVNVTHLGRNSILCIYVLWIVVGCSYPAHSPGQNDSDCSSTGLSGRIDDALALVDMDAACDGYLLNDPWTGDRANCASTAPDSVWPESCWIKTREPCHTYPCTFFDETNFGTGFGVHKTGAMTLDTVCVQEAAKTGSGWEMNIVGGHNDGATSLRIPLRVYCDLDTQCLGEINVGVSGYIEADSLAVAIRIVDGIVQEPVVEVNDLYVHVELFAVAACDDLLSDMVSWIASWVQEDLADFIGQTVKAQVETAYSGFTEDCP